MKKTIYLILSCCMCLLFVSSTMHAQTTVKGVVKDQFDVLIGANVTIAGTTIGTVTDYDGSFELSSSQALPWDLEISYVGYATKTVTVSDPSAKVSVRLEEEGLMGAEVVVSASRKREKVQEAPASISVISARKLEVSANGTDPTRNLVSTPGVQVQQQSANRINISMRGGAGLFGSSVFPIMDYRSLVGPGIGVFDTNMSGVSQLDLDRMEVVRGPGSALYGPGVTQGVVHFITKSPIDKPGTAIELMGGELRTYGASLRHATKINDKFGFKVNAYYRTGDEFTLDPNDPDDLIQINKMTTTGIVAPGISAEGFVDPTLPTTQLLTQEELDPDGDGNPMQDFWRNMGVNATLEMRPNDDLNVTIAGGVVNGSTVFYNEQGEGLNNSTEFWGQARAQWKGLFAQVFGVNNNGGTDEAPTFLYQTGNESPVGRTQLEGQLQYNYETKNFLNSNWTAGFDYRYASQDTKNQVYGRNEDDDSYSVIGGYIQGKLSPHKKLDVVVAGRYDMFNFIDEGAFAPRAALVYKINPMHTIRGSYNRANTTVSNLQLNIDFPLSTIIPGSFDVWLYGNKTEQTYTNPQLEWFTGAIPAIPIGADGNPVLDGLPLGVPFTQVNDLVIAGLAQQLAGTPLEPLAPQLQSVLEGVDVNTLGTTGGFSPGFNIFDGTPLGIVDAPISTIETHDTWEIGYKGLIGNKLGATFDVYHVTQRNNSQFTAISPAYVFQGLGNLPGDLGSAVAASTTAEIEAILTSIGQEALLPVVMGAIQGAYTQGGDAFINTPSAAFGGASLTQVFDALPFHATVPTDQVPNNGVTHLAAGYRTFDERSFWGLDLGLEYYVNDDISFFFNYSWVNRIQFQQKVVGFEDNPSLPTYLNIPKSKFRLGGNYTPETGVRASLSFQHDDAYFANAGQYTGTTEKRNLVDASLGYKFNFGLAVDISVTNLFDNEYRYLPNMPKIGRRGLARITYDFPFLNKKED